MASHWGQNSTRGLKKEELKMSTVKFKDGSTYTALAVNEATPVTIQGATRKSVEMQFAKADFDALNVVTTDSDKTVEITITDDASSYVHDNYVIRTEMARKQVMITPGTSTTAEVDEERACVTLAQLTYAEVQTAQQGTQIAALGAQVADLTLGGAVS
jgi:hypothetical protein